MQKKRGINKKEKDAKLEAHILPDIIIYTGNNYLNISVHNNNAGNIPDAKLELHLPYKQGPTRHPGSIPGWGALPAFKLC